MTRARMLPLILVLLLTGCGSRSAIASAPADRVQLEVFAAASLTEPFTEIGHMFQVANPGVTVIFNFAGSQQLAQQINQGAPVDVFASADNTQMNAVVEAGGIQHGSQHVFVKNRLAVIYPKDNPARLGRLQDLAKPGLKLVLAAPQVPVGQYSMEFLGKASDDPTFGSSFRDDVLQNVVSYEDNVKAVLAKVALGEADAGIVYTSDISGGEADSVGQLDIPESLNVIATYTIAAVKDADHPALAEAFIAFVLSPEGQDTLASFHFIPAARSTGGDSGLPGGEVAGRQAHDRV